MRGSLHALGDRNVRRVVQVEKLSRSHPPQVRPLETHREEESLVVVGMRSELTDGLVGHCAVGIAVRGAGSGLPGMLAAQAASCLQTGALRLWVCGVWPIACKHACATLYLHRNMERKYTLGEPS